jgi:hypothetical protein
MAVPGPVMAKPSHPVCDQLWDPDPFEQFVFNR